MRWKQQDELAAISHPQDREALRTAGISTLDDLWREVGKDKNHQGIDNLVRSTLVYRTALIRDLTECAVQKGREKGTSWPRRHALDLLIIGALLLLAWLVVRAVPRAQAVGIALRDLRAGERLSTDALHGADLDSLPDLLTENVPKGGYVFSEWLEPSPPVPTQEEGRLLFRLSLPLRAADADLLPSLPARVSLAVSQRDRYGRSRDTRFLWDVPVLALHNDKESPSIVAALPKSQIEAIVPLLSNVEVFVIQPLLSRGAPTSPAPSPAPPPP